MSTLRANSITNGAGSGAPDFPNGVSVGGSAVTATAAELNVLDGITAIASQAEAEAGTSSTTLMTPQRAKQAIAAQVWDYTSSEQTVTTGGTLTLAHGLGYRPVNVLLVLRCVSSNAGYSTGDEVQIGDYSGGGVYYGAVVAANSTNIIVKTGNNGIFMINSGAITNSSWRYVVRAK